MSAVEDQLLDVALDELDLPMVLATVSRQCITELGAEQVKGLRPRTDTTSLRTDLDRVQECVDLLMEGESIPYDNLGDIRPLLNKSRIEGNYLSAPDLLTVLEAMSTSRVIRRFFDEQRERAPSLHALCEPLIDDRVLEKHITDAIDDSGAIRDSASRELQAIRREIHTLSARLRSRLAKILKQYGEDELLQEDFVTQRDGRFVLPLRVENKRAVDGIIHGMSATGQTVYMEPAETYQMNNDLSLLRGREQREIIKILTVLTAEVSSVSHHLEAAFDVLTEIDTIIARARYAMEYGGLKPTIVDEELVELSDVRHPVLKQQSKERRLTSGKEFEVVPMSVTLDKKTQGILISGPNAGGKTVAMKTIGVSLAMAMCGVFPLGACTTNVRRLYTAIGDHQSIDSNLSTFSSQIIRLRDILSYCDKDALVLIDEICAGTDPAEGGALAAGVLDSLIERKASFVVTTHQSSLKQYALTRPTITNASLAFDEEKMQPTFTFLYGVPGNSYAFDLARNVGLPSVVTDRAKEYLGDRHDELEDSINAMQQFMRDAERLKLEAAQERARAASLKTDYEDRLAKVKARRSTALQDAKEEAQELLKNANALIENTIREIREQEKSAKEIKAAFSSGRDKLLSGTSEPSDTSDEPRTASEEINVGDTVVVTGTSSEGTVITIDEKRENATIDVNGIKFRVGMDQLELKGAGVSRSAREDTTRGTSYEQRATRKKRSDDLHVIPDSSMSLDMRGMRADEGLRALEQFLDDAILRNLPFATIIHGKGTGALRKVVQEYLGDHHAVQSYRLGKVEEGGDGVTIVEF